jgi:hypothetical protein
MGRGCSCSDIAGAGLMRVVQGSLGQSPVTGYPYPGKRGDKERFCLRGGYILYRLHIGRSWTAFYRIYEKENVVKVLEVMPIEQAHKKYGRFNSFSE